MSSARAKRFPALCVKYSARDGAWYLYEARGGEAVGDPVRGPFADQAMAESARFELMKPPRPKRLREGRAPREHAAPAFARSRVK